MQVAADKIRSVIGKGGATIRGITESTGVAVDIDDDGKIQLFSPDASALEEAQKQIKTAIAEVEKGKTYHGKVNKIVDFGAFITLLPGKDGLLHISQICSNRQQKVNQFLQEGQSITVFVSDIDRQGRVKLVWQRTEEEQATFDASKEEKKDAEAQPKKSDESSSKEAPVQSSD